MSSLRNQLVDAESRLLEALTDRQEIERFQQFWSTLVQDIEVAIAQKLVDEPTISLYHNTAKLIVALSQTMVEFYDDVSIIDAAFRRDVQSHLENFMASDSPCVPSTRRDTSLGAKWISENYFNPYPTNAVRDDISLKASWNRKDVDAWFIEARKRIGWNNIRRRFFNNKRVETIDQATRFFRGINDSLDPMLVQAFIKMQSRVQELFVDPFAHRNLVFSKANKSLSVNHYSGLWFFFFAIHSIDKVYSEPFNPSSLPLYATPPPRLLSPVSRFTSPIRRAKKRPQQYIDDDDDFDPSIHHKRSRFVFFLVLISCFA